MATDDAQDEPQGKPRSYGVLRDQLDAFRVLRAAGEEQREALLEEIATLGAAERDIVEELLATAPLAHSERFEAAHRGAMRAIEVLERNGGRKVTVRRLGMLDRPAGIVVSLVARWIANQHRASLVRRIRRLYDSREANAVPGTPEARMLRRARLQATHVEQGHGGGQLGVPGFLVGGAVLSTGFAAIRNVLGSAFASAIGTIVGALVLSGIVLVLAWACLYAASVARRRIRLSTDVKIAELWDAIGACGTVPRDQSLTFAIVAILGLVIAWLGIPLAVWIFFG
jgi:hypothetical protein